MGGKTILCILGGGGHTTEMLELVKLLGASYKYEFLIASNDKLTEAKLHGKIFRILNPREKNDHSLLKVIPKLIISAFQAVSVLAQSKASIILTSGPGIAVAPVIIGKLFGKKTSYIETFSRITKPSLSAKIAYPFTDLFFVQWPQLKRKFPKSVYAGRLL